MHFNKINDENGTSLASFAELLAAKAKAAGLVSVFVFAAKDGEHAGVHVISSVEGSPTTVLLQLGLSMFGLNNRDVQIVLRALREEYGESGAASEEHVLVSVSKPN